MKELIGIIAVILTFVGLLPYILDIFKGKTKPHIFTWIIWSVATTVVFFGQWVSGGGAGSWTTGATGVITIFITILAFKYGSKDITTLDKIFFIGSLFAIVPWIITNDPLISVILLTIIDVCAFIPTIRKSIKNPEEETFFTYALNIVRHSLSVIALQNYSITTFLFPSALIVMNIILTIVILPSKIRKVKIV